MNLGIYYNGEQVEIAVAKRLAERAAASGGKARLCTRTEDFAQFDRIIVLGGDGTVLRAARESSRLGIPIVGVNFGRLGFLTEFERADAEKAISLALDEGCPVLGRTMLEATLNGVSSHCLNEISLMRAVSERDGNRIAKISVTIDGSRAGEFAADGLIVATPTGSTAYSLSAGGCILTPDCASFLLTPVCAFSMRSRPIAYSDGSVLEFSHGEGSPLLLYGDGIFLGKVGKNDKFTVKKSARCALFLTAEKGGFFRRYTEKIN